MAIDTQQKRMSAMGHGRVFKRAHFPGTIDAAWRQATGKIYSGNSVGGAPPPSMLIKIMQLASG